MPDLNWFKSIAIRGQWNLCECVCSLHMAAVRRDCREHFSRYADIFLFQNCRCCCLHIIELCIAIQCAFRNTHTDSGCEYSLAQVYLIVNAVSRLSRCAVFFSVDKCKANKRQSA